MIRALEALKRACDVDLYLDSQYVKQGIESWIHAWKRNGWRTSDRKPVKNAELWRELDALAATAPDPLALGARPRGYAGQPPRRRARESRRRPDPFNAAGLSDSTAWGSAHTVSLASGVGHAHTVSLASRVRARAHQVVG